MKMIKSKVMKNREKQNKKRNQKKISKNMYKMTIQIKNLSNSNLLSQKSKRS